MAPRITKLVPDYDKIDRLLAERDLLDNQLSMLETQEKKFDAEQARLKLLPDEEAEEDFPYAQKKTTLENKIARIEQMLDPVPMKPMSFDGDEPPDEDDYDDDDAPEGDDHDHGSEEHGIECPEITPDGYDGAPPIEEPYSSTLAPEAIDFDENYADLLATHDHDDHETLALDDGPTATGLFEEAYIDITADLALEAIEQEFQNNILDLPTAPVATPPIMALALS